MAQSQNGWPGIESGSDARLAAFPWVTGKVLAGDVFTVLEYVARRFNAEVEGVNVAESWGYAYRTISGSTDLSNHSSGTAIDLNAPKHPLGASGTFAAGQVQSIRSILAATAPAVRWGGDYAGRKDEMHFEIVTDAAGVAAVAARIRGTNPPQEDDMNADQDARLKAVEAAVTKLRAAKQVMFFNYDGGVFEADILGGTYRHITSPTVLNDRQVVLTRTGTSWGNWAGADGTATVANPGAFGIRTA